jgi:hypothetical protein
MMAASFFEYIIHSFPFCVHALKQACSLLTLDHI